jgi:hypothetical protein
MENIQANRNNNKKKSQSRILNIFISNDKVEKMINLKNDQKTPNKPIFMI